MLHAGMVDWVCISAQIGIYNRTKCVCVCVVGRWGVASRLVSSSNNPPPLGLVLSAHRSTVGGQRPENSLQIAFEVRKCILDSSSLLILSLCFIQLILSVDFGNRACGCVEGQRASEGGKPPGQMFFLKGFLRWRWTYRK